jgi:lipopolysaccharide biosynthesis glycosyltransferase
MVKVSVLLCFDDRILLGAGVTILSMLQSAHAETSYDIHIFHPDFSEPVRDAFQDLVKASRHSITFHWVDATRFDGMPKGRGSWTEIVYFRLLASEILTGLDKVIYSDVDVFIKRDLAEVFSVDLTDYSWAGVMAEANTPDTICHRHFPENPKAVIYFSGFMVMNLERMRQEKAVEAYFETIRTIGPRLKFFDLDVLNISTKAIAPVPFDYVVLEDIYEADRVSVSADYPYLKSVYSEEALEAARNSPAIIHYAGRRGKPWQRRHIPDYYQRVIDQLPKLLRKRTFRDFRRRWLTAKGRRDFPRRSS